MNDLLPLNRLPLNKAHAIILSSCLTVSFEGIRVKVEGSFFFLRAFSEVRLRVQLGGFRLQLGIFSVYCIQKNKPT